MSGSYQHQNTIKVFWLFIKEVDTIACEFVAGLPLHFASRLDANIPAF
jgi:hypothetical protein